METIENTFETWKNSFSSENTSRNYETSVVKFSEMVFDKQPVWWTANDLKSLNYEKVINSFVEPSRASGVKDSTIKRDLTAVRSLVKMIERTETFSDEDIDFAKLQTSILRVDTLSMRDTEHYNAISVSELHQLEAWLTGRNFQQDDIGERYATLVDFMFKTGVRVAAALSVRWKNFSIMTSAWDNDQYAVLEIIDKGKKLNKKYLPIRYYQKLRNVLGRGDGNDKLFEGLTHSNLKKLMQQFSQEVGRNLVIHSIKAGAATSLWTRTHDLLLVRDFCDHTSVKTTENYIHRNPSPAETGSAILASENDYSKLSKLTKEQLLIAIGSSVECQSVVYSAVKQNAELARILNNQIAVND